MKHLPFVLTVFCLTVTTSAFATIPDTWYPVKSPTTESLVSIDFADDGTGYAAGYAGTILRYDGVQWSLLAALPGALLIAKIVALDHDEALAFQSSAVHHYNRGTWTTTPLGREFVPLDVDFLHRNLGYAVGLFGMMHRYDGTNWHPVTAAALTHDRETHLRGVAVLAENDVWVGTDQFLLHFDGKQWSRLPLPPGATTGHLARVDGTVALLSGQVQLRRRDRWELVFDGSAIHVSMSPNNELWGIIPDKLGSRLQLLTSSTADTSMSRRQVLAIAESKDGLWAAGEKGLIVHLEPKVLPAFIDRTFDAGAGVQAESAFGLLVDLDGAAPRDLLLAKPFGRNSFLRGEEKGTFHPSPITLPTLDQWPDASSITSADIDGDGWWDLVLQQADTPPAKPTRIMRNLGALRFLDMPIARSADSTREDFRFGTTAIADLDSDGDLDIYEIREHSTLGVFPLPNVLYRNDGFGHLTTEILGHREGGAGWAWSVSAVAADLTGDGRTDLLSANSWGDGNTFFRQNDDGTLSDMTVESGLAGDAHQTRQALSGDIDQDGDLDVLICTAHLFGPSRLYENDGHGHFHDITTESGIESWFVAAGQAEFVDMDLDGDLDLVLGQAFSSDTKSVWQGDLRLLINDGRGHFSDATEKTGIDQQASRFVADDFDDDGDIDLYLIRRGDSNRLLANEPPYRGYVKVRLESAPPNREALGARVSVFDTSGSLIGFRETDWQRPVAHFGLGSADSVTVEARFPSGRVIRRAGVARGSDIVLSDESWFLLQVHKSWFFLRHRWSWSDRNRDALSLLISSSFLVALWRMSKWLGTRFFVRRPLTMIGLFAVFFFLRLGWMDLEPVSIFARIFPSATLFVLGCVIVVWDRHATHRADARFVGPYELISELGRGGMGIVYKARDTSIAEKPIVALKVLQPDRIKDPASMRRFVREADIGSRLSDPGIASVFAGGECRVFEGGVWHTTAYLAMEFVEGTSFANLLADTNRLPLVRRLEIVRDAALALSAAHAVGVLHRDVKPDNILLSRAGVVKLVDFGIAATLSAPSRTEVGLIVGTLAYMPPERAAGTPEDMRGDLYSLGAVLYEAIAGRRPFDDCAGTTGSILAAILHQSPPSLRALQRDIPESLNDLVDALLAKKPAMRPASARIVADQLDAIIHELRGEAKIRTIAAPAVPPTTVTADIPLPIASDSADPWDRETLDIPQAPPMPKDASQGAFDRETLDLPRSDANDG